MLKINNLHCIINRQCIQQVRFYTQFNVQPISSSDLDTPRKKVLLYRSRQRGLLELDVIVGSFAEKYLSKFSEEQVEEFENVLATESPDLYKLLNGQMETPEELKNNSVFAQLLNHVHNQ